MQELPTLHEILDNIVEDVKKEFPGVKDEFEASFYAAQMHLGIVIQMMSMAGMEKQSLDAEELYRACWNLLELNKWMAAKQLAAIAMREIESM